MDVNAFDDKLDKLVAEVKAGDKDGVARDLIENLEGHITTVKMRVGNIADRVANHQKENK